MDTASPDVGKEVGSAVLGEGLLPLFGDCASFCSIFGPWRVVAQSAQEARALCSDDGNREAASHLMEQEATFRGGDVAAFHPG